MTSRCILNLNRLSPRDRLVLGLVRGVSHPHLGDDVRMSFDILRDAARKEGVILLGREVLFLGSDEMKLLGLLAMLQRPCPECALVASGALRDALSDCAQRLVECQLLLDRRNLVRIRGISASNNALGIQPVPGSKKLVSANRPFSAPAPSTLQARALRFIEDRCVTSRTLRNFGLSRQVVHLMFKRGLLTRASSGLYQASAQSIAWLTACP